MDTNALKGFFKNPLLYQAVGTVLGGGLVYYAGFRHGKMVMREQAIAAFEAHEVAQAMLVPASRVEIDDEQAAWEELERLKAQVGEEVFEELVEVTKANAQMDAAEPSEEVKQSIFSRHDDWNWEHEVEVRNMTAGPYIITKEEYLEESDPTWTQMTATWYEADEMLVDDAGLEPVFNWSDRVGQIMFRWGHGSGDPNVVYIRNPDEQIEWEIMRHTGAASEEVHGIAPGEPSTG